MPLSPDHHIYGIDDVSLQPSRTCTPPSKANSINAGDENRLQSNKRGLRPTATGSSQDPSAGRLGKGAQVDPAPLETPGGSSATQVSALLADTNSSSAGTLLAANKRAKVIAPPDANCHQ
ncbi:hypothetical protein FBU31_000146, partial [Coemansia sp. 'formosensis']